MAEFVSVKDMVEKIGAGDDFHIASAATSTEEIGNPGASGNTQPSCRGGSVQREKYARQMTKEDYREYDYLIGMDRWNLRSMERITGRTRG